MARGSSILLATLCLALGSTAGAQPQVIPLGVTPKFEEIQQPQSLRYYNALINHHEWGLPDQGLFSVGNAYSLLQPTRPLDAFLAHYHQRRQDISLGSQFLNNATPIYEQLLVQGARWGWHEGPWATGLWYGQTQDALQELQGQYLRQQLAGLSLAYTPNDFGSYGFSVMPYASLPSGGFDRTLYMGQVYHGGEWESGASYGLSLGYGLDSGGAGAQVGGRQAFRLLGGYSSQLLNLDFSTRSLGHNFGPPTGMFDLRGTSFSNLVGTVHLSPEWSLSESANLSDIGMGGTSPTHVSSFMHSIRYYRDNLSVTAGVQQLDLLSQDTNLHSDSFFLSLSGNLGKTVLSGQLRHNQGSLQDDEVGLGITYPLFDNVKVRLQEFYTSGQSGANSLATNAGVLFDLGELGSADIGYYRQDSIQNTVLFNASRDNLVANADLNLLGNLKLRASVNPQAFSLIGLRWVADEHNEFMLEHRFQQNQNRFFYSDYTNVPLGHITTLSWTTSWGGPIEKRLRSELEGKARIQVRAHPPGSQELSAVANATMTLGKRQATTDQEGNAYFSQLLPGHHKVALTGGLGEAYEIEGSSEREFDVDPGRTAQLAFQAIAYSGFEVVVFNDADDQRQIKSFDYTPIAGVRVRLDGLGEELTPADGKILRTHLQPGPYRISLDKSSLEAGMELTTPEQVALVLEPGKTQRVVFGVRGFGDVAVQLLEFLPGAMTAEGARPAPNVGIRHQSQLLGRTDAKGELSAHLPAGRVALQLDVPDTALASGSLNAEVRVNRQNPLPLTFYRLAQLKVRIDGAPSVAGSAISLEGPDGKTYPPAYLSPQGFHDFRQLPIGRYRLRLEPDTLPAGYAPQRAVYTVDLGSRDRRQLDIHLVRRRI